jgi:hypothetical protein
MADVGPKALHTAARRYCIDGIEATQARWHTIHMSQAQGDYYLQQLDVARQCYEASAINDFARLMASPGDETDDRLLQVILNDLERLTPDDFRSSADARAFLRLAGQRARVIRRWRNSMTEGGTVQEGEPILDEAQQHLRDQTRADYLAFVSAVTVEQAVKAGPLPFRQVMSESKRQRVRKNLAQRWQVDPSSHYWYPLWGDPLPPDVLPVRQSAFYREVGAQRLQTLLLRRGIARIWQIHEDTLVAEEDPEYELDPRLCNFYPHLETYWAARHLDWLIYISHEDSITFAGAWLISAIQQIWPSWQDHIRHGHVGD